MRLLFDWRHGLKTLSKLSKITGILVSSLLLVACSGAVNPVAEGSFEQTFADKTVGAVKTSQDYSGINKSVSAAQTDALQAPGAPTSEKSDAGNQIKALLKKNDLTDLDRAVLTYQLARYQMYRKQFDKAGQTFQVTLSLVDALKDRPPNLLKSIYFSYYRCLAGGGHPDEANEFKAKFNMEPEAKVAGE